MENKRGFINCIDHAAEIYNQMISINKEGIREEIRFIDDNYRNEQVLKQYFCRLYPAGSIAARYNYINSIGSYSLEMLQQMAVIRSNCLLGQYCN